MRRAVRDEIRRGASHIKIMASGGVASPSDPLERCQFSDEEILAATDEARRAGVYVAAHCHPAEAIERSVRLGVRSIEHGTLIDAPTAELVARSDAWVVPTLAVIFALKQDGAQFGLPPASIAKLDRIADRALAGLEIMQKAGVRMGFGTDLLGPHYDRQATEFELRREVLPAIDILRSVCSVNADLMGESHDLGRIKEGALADLLLVEGDPVADITVMARPASSLAIVMQGGRFHRRRELATS
jgi:imidazolonepropionase-like amidohydrolase